MKEIIAIIRPERWLETAAALDRLPVVSCARHRALGRGSTQGLRYLSAQGAGIGGRYLPKHMLSVVVEAAALDEVVQAIVEVNRTGRLGDGKVFVLPLEETSCAGTRAPEIQAEEYANCP